jgi:Ca2+-binding RTX toxin-like protein
MSSIDQTNLPPSGAVIDGSDEGERLFGTELGDMIAANGGDDQVFGLSGDDTLSGGAGEDILFGDDGDDIVVGNTGNDLMFGGDGDDRLVWNNGDGSDLMVGGDGEDEVQVNFDTDLVNDDLQNKDVAEYSVTSQGVQFARIEVNDQTERGLFQLDIRETETLETNFGGGDDTAVIVDDVLDRIALDLDGGDGVDTLDLSQAAAAVKINLAKDRLDDATVANFENVIGTEFDDKITGDNDGNVISGLGGADRISGRNGDDTLVGGKGDDQVRGGKGDDLLVWNNGDGSDLMNGGRGEDVVQVNFDTDLVNDDLQNKDVAEFSVTNKGVQFARIEVNDQTERGLFQLDIRKTETLETNFGGGDDTAVIVDDVLDRITLDLDGGDGVDTLDLSQASSGLGVDLAAGTLGSAAAVGFENVTGTAFDDVIYGDDGVNVLLGGAGNDRIDGRGGDDVIDGGAGNDILAGGAGADTFVFKEGDAGVDVIIDFQVGIDTLAFQTSDPSVTAESLLAGATQVGDDVEFALPDKVITIQDALVTDFIADDFMFA